MSDEEIMDHAVVESALPALPAVPAYALVRVAPFDAAALAKFQADLPSVALTIEEQRFDPSPHIANDAEFSYDAEELLAEALPKYKAHRAVYRQRMRDTESMAVEPVPLEICAGWMGATPEQAAELNAGLLALSRKHDEQKEKIDGRFYREMEQRHRAKADAIMPDTLATVREGLYQYEQIPEEDQDRHVLTALQFKYAELLVVYVEEILGRADDKGVFTIRCRTCGLPFGSWDYDKNSGKRSDVGDFSAFCKSAHEREYITAYIRDHQPMSAEDEECLYEMGVDSLYSILKGDLWGIQCSTCGHYFLPLATMPKNFPALTHKACSWLCLCWQAVSWQSPKPMADYVDPELSRGSEWWQAIKLMPFPTDTIAEAKRQAKQGRPAPRSARVTVIEPSASPMAVRGSDPAMADRILSVFRGLDGGELIEDRPLRKAAGITSSEVAEYVAERDRLHRAGVIGRRGSGRRGSPFQFWFQSEPE